MNDLIYVPEDVDSVYAKSGVDEWLATMKRNGEKLEACNDKAIKVKSLVGRVFKIGVADGYASYQVVKENGTRVTIHHCVGLGDDYMDHHFGGGGSFSKKDVMRYIGWEDSMRKLFGK